MTSGSKSARLAPPAAVALLLAAQASTFAAVLPEGPGEDPARSASSRPSTGVPAPPLSLPGMAPVRLAPGPGLFPGVHPLLDGEMLSFRPVIATDGVAAFRADGFSARLLSMMGHEAQRYRERNVSEAGGAPRNDPLGEFDSAAEATRSAVASRVITRSSHRALGNEIERVARASLGLGPSLDLLQNLSLRRTRTGTPDAGSPSPGQDRPPAAPPNDAPRLRGDVAFRLDAHPALLLRARLGTLRGRIDLPVRNEPIRVSLESPLGARGHAVLSSGLPRDGQPWATLTFSFGF